MELAKGGRKVKGFIQIENDLIRVDSIIAVIDETYNGRSSCTIRMITGNTYSSKLSAYKVKEMMEAAQ